MIAGSAWILVVKSVIFVNKFITELLGPFT